MQHFVRIDYFPLYLPLLSHYTPGSFVELLNCTSISNPFFKECVKITFVNPHKILL